MPVGILMGILYLLLQANTSLCCKTERDNNIKRSKRVKRRVYNFEILLIFQNYKIFFLHIERIQ